MKIDERVYNEYANWKLDNSDFINELELNAPSIYFRFKHIINVIEYYYNKLIDDVNYTQEDDAIFRTGFYYITDQLSDVDSIYSKAYKKDIKLLEKHSKEINLFLNTLDFQTELMNNELDQNEDVQKLMDFDQDVYKYIMEKKTVPEEYYEELDMLTFKIFKSLDINYYSVNDIFLEIADQLNML